MLLWALATATVAVAQTTNVVEWNFTSSTSPWNASAVNAAVTTNPVVLQPNGSITTSRVASGTIYASAGSIWAGSEDTGFIGTRTSLTPRSAKSLSTKFTLTPQASGSWTDLTVSFSYQRPSTAPTKARAVITWQSGSSFKRAYTGAMTLSGTAWTTASAKFQSGDTLPTTLAGLPCLVELYFWGTSTTPNGINIDNLKLLANSLANVWTMTPASLSDGMQNQAYSATFGIASYGTGTITWSSNGTLPLGLALGSTTGMLSGTPTGTGTSSFTVTATGPDLNTSKSYSLTIAPEPIVGVGNAVFNDTNFNGRYDTDEGISGVAVQLLNTGGTVLQSTTTGTGGGYLFSGLSPGSYKVKIPASEFAAGKRLFGMISVPGNGGDDGVDDSADENGIDDAAAATNGIVSSTIVLAANAEPVDGGTETGYDKASDNADDNNTNLTVDFGFRDNPAFSVGDRVFKDGNSNGVYDPGEGVDGVSVQLLNASNTVVDTQTTANDGRYRFAGLSAAQSYYVRVAGTNFSGGSALENWASISGNGGDDGVDRDDNGVDETTPGTNGVKSVLISPDSTHGGIYAYTWPGSGSATSTAAGGAWSQVSIRHNYVSEAMDVSVTLDTATQNTQALWMVITNGVSTATTDSTLAACYLANGAVRVTPYTKSPTASNSIDTTIYTTTYSTLNVGTKRTFRFTLDTSAINGWASRPVGWKGIGFPYDAQGNAPDAGLKKLSINMRAYADGAAVLSGNSWVVTWGGASDQNIGTFSDTAIVTEVGGDSSIDFGFVPGVDYGDWPGFLTASQAVSSEIKIGTTATDADYAIPDSGSAVADDETGVNDEDLVMPLLTAGASTPLVIPVTLSGAVTSGRIGVWVDWNGDDDVADTSEIVTLSTASLVAGSNNITATISPPAGTAAGTKYLRIRVVQGTTAPQFSGVSNSAGEVEDYAVSVVSNYTYSSVLWMSTSSSSTSRLESYNIATGVKTIVGPTSDSSNRSLFDIAWSPAGKLYGIEAGSPTRVYEINPANGALTRVGNINGSFNGMVFGSNGSPYVSSLDNGDIYTFNMASLSSGSTTSVSVAFNAPTNAPNGQALVSGGDLAWVGPDLFYAATGGFTKFYLYKVPQGSTSVQLVGEIKGTNGSPIANVFGLIGDGYGTLYGQAGSTLYQLNRDTAVGTVAATSISPNSIYGGAMQFESMQINEDFGDYAGFGEAKSNVLNTLKMGALLDGDAAGANAAATTDDLTGVDDEDGVSLPGSVLAGSSVTVGVNVNNTTGATAYLNAWIDWNNNGVLTDAGEQIASNIVIANGTADEVQNLGVTVPSLAAAVTVGARFRLTSVTSPGPVGLDGYGEVEDYKLSVTLPSYSIGNLVFNDVNNNGVKDSGENGISGLTVQLLNGGTNAVLATTTTNGSGVYGFTTGVAGSYKVRVTPNGTFPLASSTTGTDNGTDDRNDGTQPGGQGTVSTSFAFNLTVNGEPGTAGSGNAENTIDFGFRACPTITLSPTSLPAPTVAVVYNQTVTASGGTAPYTYSVASGALPVGLVISSDGVITGTTNSAASATVELRAVDANGCAGTRSYTITPVCPTISLMPLTLPNASAFANYSLTSGTTVSASGGAGSYLYSLAPGAPAWLSISGSSGQLSGTPTASASGVTFTVNVVDANGCPSSRGYTINVTANADFGDYASFASASSVATTQLRIGAAVDTEASATTNSAATGDDITGSDDEDGVTLPANLTAGTSGTVTVQVTNTFGATAYLNGWIDFNNNGSLADVGEQVITNVAITTGTNGSSTGYTVNVPGSATAGNAGARFRLTSVASPGPTGATGAGEVEDYIVNILPASTLSIGNLVWDDCNNDGIKQPDETGLEGASVRLFSSGPDNTVNTGDDTLVSGPQITSSTGAYVFSSLAPGKYYVRVTPPVSFYRTGGTPVTTDNGVDHDNNGSQPGGLGTACYSPIITLTAGAEPSSDDGDTNTDMTVDFGLWSGFLVGNLVWDDVNNDGIHQVGEPGLNGVSVQLMAPGADLQVGGDDDTVVLATSTNSSGLYSFRVPATGTFFVRVTPYAGHELPSAISSSVDDGIDENNNGIQPEGAGTYIYSSLFTLAPCTEPGSTGTTNDEISIDFGLRGCPTIMIGPAALTPAIAGQAHSEQLTATGGVAPYTWTLVTGELPAGVTLDSSGLISGTPPTSASSNVITVEARDALGCTAVSGNLTFKVVSLAIGNLVWNDINFNGLRDVGELGVAGAEVSLFQNGVDEAPYTEDDVQIGTTIMTGADGSYRFEGLVTGDYYVKVMPTSGLPVATANAVANDDGVDNDNNGMQPGGSGAPVYGPVVSLAPGDEPTVDDGDDSTDLTVDFGLFSGLCVGNLVWLDSNNNGVKDLGEGAVAGVLVQIWSAGTDDKVGGTDDSLLNATTTDSTGNYQFNGLLAGKYYVRIPAPPASAPISSGQTSLLDDAVDNDDNGIQLSGGAIYSPVLTLEPFTEPGTTGSTNCDSTIDFGLVPASTAVVATLSGDDSLQTYEGTSGAFVSTLVPAFGISHSQGNDDPGDVPWGIKAGPDGNWYVAHYGVGNLRRITPGGTDQGLFLSAIPGITQISQFGIGPDGNFYVLDGSSARVVRFHGPLSSSVGTPMDAAPYAFISKSAKDIAFGPDGNLYLLVLNGLAYQVERYDINTGELLNVVVTAAQVGSMTGGGSSAPVITGIDIDDTTLYGVTKSDHEVFKVSLLAPAAPGLPQLVADLDSANAGAVDTESLRVNPETHQLIIAGYRWSKTVRDGIILSSALIQVDPVGAPNGIVTFHEVVMPTPPGPVNETFPGVRDVAFATRPVNAAALCSIGSSVWNDENYDGVHQNGEPGIGNVKLELWHDANDNLTDGAEDLVGWTFTDSYGHYYFNGLVPGRYQVVITGSNFAIGAPLATFGLNSQLGSAADDGVDGDDNGYQPAGEGGATTSPIITLSINNEPLGDAESGAELAAGGDLDNLLGDASGDMTVDFAFSVPGSLGIGNVVFVDIDGNARYDEGEGEDGVTVELYGVGQTPGVSAALATTTTDENGRYRFSSLVPGTYRVFIPSSEFSSTGRLRNTFSLPGVQLGDDDLGEDGIDVVNPATTGVVSTAVSINENTAPTDATGETGVDADSDNASPGGDDDVDLTVDLGFYRRVGVGNLVFFDANGNGVADTGEGVEGVTVELYRFSQSPGSDAPVGTTMTDAEGKYLFVDLLPGLYVVHIPAEMFAETAPLEGRLSIAEGRFGDDDAGEDGRNDSDPAADGVTSSEVFLMSGLAPTAENGESGTDSESDDTNDAAIDLTVDLGFQQPVSVGNLVYKDLDGNGHYDVGEGVDGVLVELYRTGAIPGFFSPVVSTTTMDGGHYRFDGLPGGSYYLLLPPSNFGSGGPLEGFVSMTGFTASGNDDNVGEKGLDNGSAISVGVSTADFVLLAGSLPTDATGESGYLGSEDNTNLQDANGDMTMDFGFIEPDPNKVGLGNAVYSDINGNGTFDEGEGIDGVTLRLYDASVTTPTDLNMMATTTTISGGYYFFGGLDPGSYYIVVAASNFAANGKLYGKFSVPGQGGDNGLDDETDENGDDPADPSLQGVKSTIVTLAPNMEPTDFDTELGQGTYMDSDNDANIDMTVDFGFYQPVGVGNLVFVDNNGNKKADVNEGVAGVTVNLFRAGQNTIDDPPVATLTTGASPSKGKFMFTNLVPGNYFLHIPPEMFGSGGPLFNKVSMTGVEASQKDDNGGENGVDPADIESQGVSTAVFALNPGLAPFGTGEGGQFGSDDNNTTYGDKNYDLTRDFGFASNVAVGNLVFRDMDLDGKFTNGVDEGVNNVTVELWKVPTTGSATLAETNLTANGGRYLFSVKPGTYYVKVPASMFDPGAPLANTLATTLGSTTTVEDDDVGQDAADSGNPVVNGAVTASFVLTAGTQPTAAGGETGFDSASDDSLEADSNLTVDLGFRPLPLTVGNLVFRDNNADGIFDAGDSGLGGVTVELFTFGSDPQEDTPVATTVTATNGTYSLQVYEEGQYIVHVPMESFATGSALAGFNSSPGVTSDSTDDDLGENGVDAATPSTTGVSSGLINLLYGFMPVDSGSEHGFLADSDNGADANGDLTIDFGFRIPPPGSPLAGQVRRTLGGGTVATDEAALPGVELNVFSDTNGNGVVDTNEMTAAASAQTDDSGGYVIEGLAAGSYIVEATPLPGAVAVADTDGGAPDKTTVVITDQPREGIDFVQSLTPDTFAQWKAAHALDGANKAADNPDGDGYDNLMEYALGTDPESGVLVAPRFYLSATAEVDAVIVRNPTGHKDVRYVLEGSTDRQSWLPLTKTGNSSFDDDDETVRFAGVSADPVFAGKTLGYVRLKVELDADMDGTIDASSVTAVQAFALRSFGSAQSTLSMPLLRLPLYAGEITAVNGEALAITGGTGLKDALVGSAGFFAEVTSGAHVGERFEVDVEKTTDISLALKAGGSTASDLAGSGIVVRPHWTLGALLPGALFRATTSPVTADRALFYENGNYAVHWLLSTKQGAQWVRAGDSKLGNAGTTRIIAPHEGLLVQCRGTEVRLPLVGEVRTRAWVESFKAGSQLIGTGLTTAATPNERALTIASGLVTGDRLLLWTGDQTPGSNAFSNLTLSATDWVRDADQAVMSQEKILEPFRASYLVLTQPLSIKRQPLP